VQQQGKKVVSSEIQKWKLHKNLDQYESRVQATVCCLGDILKDDFFCFWEIFPLIFVFAVSYKKMVEWEILTELKAIQEVVQNLK